MGNREQVRKCGRCPIAAMMVVTIAGALGVGALASSEVIGCEPPITMWVVTDAFPTPNSTDAPLNGTVVLQLDFIDAFGLADWPEDSVVEETVNLWLTREEEVVEGVVEFDRVLHEARFTATLPMAEGIEYTVHIEFLNSTWGYPDTLDTVSFTTGDRFDEAGPAFSGLQRVGLSEQAEAVQDCCESTDDYCLGMCGPCQWCWTTGWEYLPLAQLSFRAVEDEFGPSSVRYAIYELDSLDGDLGEPKLIVSPETAGEQNINLVVDGAGPHCFAVRAHDAYGRWDSNSTVMCVGSDEKVPVTRLDVPPPDRQYCAETQGDDAGVDTGVSDVGVDSGEDAAPNEDTADAGDAGPTEISTGSSDDGCGCTVGSTAAAPWSLLFAAFGIAAALVRRRQQPRT